MNDIVEIFNDVAPSRADIDELQRAVIAMPQVEPDTTHFFVTGMYCRKVAQAAGILVVGKVHKTPHFFVCVSGELRVWSEGLSVVLKAGDVTESQPGTKRVLYAVTDAVYMNVHKTDKTDLAEIEDDLVEPDHASQFGVGNVLRSAAIEAVKIDD